MCLLALKAPGGLLVFSSRGNLTVCWSHPPDNHPDGYHVTKNPLGSPTISSLWINQSSPGVLWINESMCIDLGALTPGQTYEVGVIALKGNERSQWSSIIHTTGERNRNAIINNVDAFSSLILYNPLSPLLFLFIQIPNQFR